MSNACGFFQLLGASARTVSSIFAACSASLRCIAIVLGVWCCQFSYAQSSSASAEDLKKLSIEELLNVDIQVTSVSRRPEKLSEAPSAVQVITQEDIRRSGASSLPEALRLASNLEVTQINARQWAVSARGLLTDTANELLVMIDGRSVYMPRLAGVYWDVQDTMLEDIERIEVVSGPGATLWGANAVNGVINIITKSARDTQGTLLVGVIGDEINHLGAVRYGDKLGNNFNYRVYLKQQDHDGPVDANGNDVDGDWRSAQGGFRVDGNLSAVDALTVSGDLYGMHFQQPASPDIVARGGNVIGRWSRHLADDAALTLQLYYDHTFRDTPNLLRDELDTYDIDLQHRFVWNSRHSLVWGMAYRRYDNDTRTGTTVAYIPARQLLTVYSGFIQDEIGLFKDRLKLSLGTKLEHNDYTGFEFQPSARLAWLIDPKQTVWSAVSRAVRTPARNDREQYIPANPPYTRVGNDDFVSEELIAYELGYRLHPVGPWSLSLATFYDDYDKVRSIERVDPTVSTPTVIGNGQQGYSYGAEFTADYYVTDWWRLHFADTEIRIQLRPRPGSTDFSYGANESFDPRHQLSLRSSFDLRRGWQLDGALRHVSRLSNQDTPAYTELNLRVAWQMNANIEWSLVGENLLHSAHREFVGTAGIREIERSIYGKVQWSF